MHFLGDLSGVFLDGLYIFGRNMYRRNDAGRVTGMYTGQLNMLHYCRNKGIGAVADGIGLTFHGMIQETVDQDRTIRSYTDSGLHIADHAFVIVNHFHTAAAQDIGRTNHNRISDLSRDGQSFFYGRGHTGLGHGDLQLLHHGTEQIAVLSQINNRGGCSQNTDTVFLQISSQIQRCLTAKLSNYTQRFLFVVDT